MSIKCILFDLDGTLVDSALDFIEVLNAMLSERQAQTIDVDELRPYVSFGTKGMLKCAFDIEPEDEGFQPLKTEFLALCQERIKNNGSLFPGVDTLLNSLDEKNIPWGVVTNKEGYLAQATLKSLNLSERAHCLVCGDTLDNKKPHPATLLHACKLLELDPKHCLYLGDAIVDMQAAKAAGMLAVIAGYGYVYEKNALQQWGADHEISHPHDILEWLS